MRTYTRFCLLLTFGFFLAGCYESKVPMASSDDSVIDESLVGQWKELSESAGISADMTVLKFNHNEYYARYGDGKSIIHCRAYIVIVDGQAFINAQNIKDSDDNQRTFVFFRYSLADDGFLTLRMAGTLCVTGARE